MTGGTDNHMLLVDLSRHGLTAREAEARLEHGHIAVSAIHLPNRGNTGPNGLRLGTAAITTRGFGAAETKRVAELVADVLDGAAPDQIELHAAELCSRFPVYP